MEKNHQGENSFYCSCWLFLFWWIVSFAYEKECYMFTSSHSIHVFSYPWQCLLALTTIPYPISVLKIYALLLLCTV